MSEMMDVVSTIKLTVGSEQPIHTEQDFTDPQGKSDFFIDSIAVTIVPVLENVNWNGTNCLLSIKAFKVYLRNSKEDKLKLFFKKPPILEEGHFNDNGYKYKWKFTVRATYEETNMPSPYWLPVNKVICSGEKGDVDFKLKHSPKKDPYIAAGQICRFTFY